MNRILLIGNGFDLAHNLQTGYKHFINNLWNDIKADFMAKFKPFGKEYPYSMADVIEIIVSCRNNRNLSSNTDWLYYNPNGCIGYPWFEEILKSYTRISEPENGLPTTRITYINAFLSVISKNYTSKNWSGIETDYYGELIKCLSDKSDKRVEQLHKEFSYIEKNLKRYLEDLTVKNPVKKIEKIRRIIDDYELKVDEFYKKPTKPSLEETLLLSVNYTNTEKLYIKDDSKILHIHGELNNPDNPIIFGYGDETDKEYKTIKSQTNNEYLKNMKSLKYYEADNHRILRQFIDTNEYEVFVMGHSCGISDKDLLKPLFEDGPCLSIRVFYHKINNNSDDYSDIAKNMERIFTDSNLMKNRLVNKKLSTSLS